MLVNRVGSGHYSLPLCPCPQGCAVSAPLIGQPEPVLFLVRADPAGMHALCVDLPYH